MYILIQLLNSSNVLNLFSTLMTNISTELSNIIIIYIYFFLYICFEYAFQEQFNVFSQSWGIFEVYFETKEPWASHSNKMHQEGLKIKCVSYDF